ncbi:MAG: DUF1559 domain-containing protein [Planctomycetales bacterium]
MSHFPSRSRGGFTLIEMLVVMVIIAILMALLLPAVQVVREAANQRHCLNNLRNLGLGVAHYTFTRKYLPTAGYEGKDKAGVTRKEHNWVPLLMPFIEEETLFNMYRMDRDWHDSANANAIRMRIPVLECRSTPSPDGREHLVEEKGKTMTVGACDYAAPRDVPKSLSDLGLITKPKNNKGLMNRNSRMREVDVHDGLSQTLLFLECAGRPLHYVAGGNKGPIPHDSGGPGNQVNSLGVRGSGWANLHMDSPPHGYNLDGLTNPGPCVINCTNHNEPYSFHPDGMNIVMGDGSAHFISESISVEVFVKMITYKGEDVVSVGAW